MDEQVYLNNLRYTFNDKAWFLKGLPKEIDTIVDFGCADGSFIKWLSRKHNFRMIGVDNNESFRKRCKENGIEVYPRLSDVDIAHRRVLLVLNSVLHEVATYSGMDGFWFDVRAFRPVYIAIRDMNIRVDHTLYTKDTEREFRESVNTLPGLADQYSEFRGCFHGSYDPYDTVHFLMKYFHKENWLHECAENYNALKMPELVTSAREAGYDVLYEKHFLLPYFWKRWLSDFSSTGVSHLLPFLFSLKTHVKMLLKRTEENEQ